MSKAPIDRRGAAGARQPHRAALCRGCL